jgi:hypothetical protein
MYHSKPSERETISFLSHNKTYFGQVTLSQKRGNKNSNSTKTSENKKEKNSRDKKEYPLILHTILPYWKCRKNFAHKNGSLVTIIPLKV